MYIYTDVVQRRLSSFGASELRGCGLDLASRSTQPRRASTRLDRLNLDELRRGSIEPASTSSGEARSTSLDELRRGSMEPASSSTSEGRSSQPQRAPARLDRPSLHELRRGSIEQTSTAFDDARPARLRRTWMQQNVQLIDHVTFVRAVTFWQHRPLMPRI